MEAGSLRQRGIGLVGAIVAMVIAGLIVYGIIYYGPDIWHRIREGEGNGETTISDLMSNPAAHDNEEVKVVGNLLYGMPETVTPIDGYANSGWRLAESDYTLDIYMGAETTYQLGWGETGRVRVTGIFRSPNVILAKRLERA